MSPASYRPDTLADELRRLEPLLAQGQWEMVQQLLGPDAKAQYLAPALGLLYVTAQEELAETSTDATDPLALRCAAELFGLPPDSATTAMLASRITTKYTAQRMSFGNVMSKVTGWFRR